MGLNTSLEARADRLEQAALRRMTVSLTTAAIQAKTSGTAFNVGSALPERAMVRSVEVNVAEVVAGGSLSAVTLKVQNTGETAGALMGAVDVFTATGRLTAAGSNPYAMRGGQQLQATLTATDDTLAHATTGSLSIDVIYCTSPIP